MTETNNNQNDHQLLIEKLRQARQEHVKHNKVSSNNNKKRFSDDFVDGLAAVCIIAVFVAGVSIWLEAMP